MNKINILRIIRSASVFWVVAGWACIAQASPVAEDYRQCHRVAVEDLRQCLDRQPGSDNAACWDRGRQAQQACYAALRADHAPDRKRRAAEEAARRESAASKSR